jgi:hypothetical protein
MCEREACSLTLRKDHEMRMFENRVLRKHVDLRRMKQQETGENRIMRKFITFAPRKIQ